MKILLGHSFPDRAAFGATWIGNWLARLRTAGFDVQPFSLVVDQRRPVMHFRELDFLWRHRARRLLALYDRLGAAVSGCDAFVCFNGSNVHPDLLPTLGCFTVYACFDDPESSNNLSRPVAAAFDLAMVGNVAEVDTYRSWGVRNARWWPLGFRHDDYDPSLSLHEIMNGRRDNDVALLCERVTRFRKARVDRFVRAFPHGAYFGQGWPAGFLPESRRVPLLQRTRIGINIHNSTGPINFRTFYLPANGVLQICDNKSHLGKVFAPGTEVIGYESIEEAIDLTRYYLDHEEERRRIAAAGWQRAVSDYSEAACFKRLEDAIRETQAERNHRKESRECGPLGGLGRGGFLQRLHDATALAVWTAWGATLRAMRRFAKRILYGTP